MVYVHDRIQIRLFRLAMQALHASLMVWQKKATRLVCFSFLFYHIVLLTIRCQTWIATHICPFLFRVNSDPFPELMLLERGKNLEQRKRGVAFAPPLPGTGLTAILDQSSRRSPRSSLSECTAHPNPLNSVTSCPMLSPAILRNYDNTLLHNIYIHRVASAARMTSSDVRHKLTGCMTSLRWVYRWN